MIEKKDGKNDKGLSSVGTDAKRTAKGNDDDQESSASGAADLSGEAAGAVRGISRSIVRAPLIGRIPARAPKVCPPPSSIGRGILRRRVPIRRVAHVSDRVATGLDVYTSALEVEEEAKSKSPSKLWLIRARSFAWNLFRNTLLGMAVFEGYGYVIGSLAPPLSPEASFGQNSFNPERDGRVQVNLDRDAIMKPAAGILQEENDEYDDDTVHFGEPDEYSRVALPLHYLAGATAGCIHGLGSSVIEGNPTSTSMAKYTAWNTLHHSFAHALLFGSYETIKRAILTWHDDDDLDGESKVHRESRAYHLIAFGVAGGFAGQIQHLVSHYAEETVLNNNNNQTLQLPVDWRSSIRKAPPLRPFLWAFPPTAIGFIAFEYGKEFSTT